MDIEKIRNDFPILQQKIYNRPLVYLDNAATTQLPNAVLFALQNHYLTQNGNVHRGAHALSNRATDAMEETRAQVAALLGAKPKEIVFTSGATDSLHLVAEGFVRPRLRPGSKLITTQLEHHANFLPWQQLAKEAGAKFVVIPMKEDGIDLERLEKELDEGCVLLSVTAVSNVTGVALPLQEIIAMAHERGVPVCVDASQAMRHGGMKVDELDCDFLVFSAHKMMGPAGVGVLYGKEAYLAQMRPVRFGGGMADVVREEESGFSVLPHRLEAGTPNYPGIIAFGAGLSFLQELGLSELAKREAALSAHLEQALREIPGVHVLGGSAEKKSVVSLVVDGVVPYDLALLLDKFGVATRSGAHCAQPLLRAYGQNSVLRFSVAFYNTFEEIDFAVQALQKAISLVTKKESH